MKWLKWLSGWAVVGLILYVLLVWLGLSLMPVKTGSMRPMLYPGDLVIGVNPGAAKPKVGDVVVATPRFASNSDRLPPIAHRIIRPNPDGSWTTKGDFNPDEDGWLVQNEDISKVMIGHIPVNLVQNPMVIIVGVALFALAFLWPRGDKDPPTGRRYNLPAPRDVPLDEIPAPVGRPVLIPRAGPRPPPRGLPPRQGLPPQRTDASVRSGGVQTLAERRLP